MEKLIEEKTRKVNKYNLEVDYDDYKGEITLDSDAFDTDYKLIALSDSLIIISGVISLLNILQLQMKIETHGIMNNE